VTKFFLIRHAENDLVGHTLAGRKPGVHLNNHGRSQAARLAEKLSKLIVTKIVSSPMERAIETAEPLAALSGRQIEIREAFNELNFGDWTGQKFADLESQELWRQWNSHRLGIRAPNGEMMIEVQTRFVTEIEALRRSFPTERIAIFSHGDPLKSVLMYYLGIPLDHFLRLDIATSSFSILALSDWAVKLQAFNLQPDEGRPE
jgi:broad specificity phosphatase PhoE